MPLLRAALCSTTPTFRKVSLKRKDYPRVKGHQAALWNFSRPERRLKILKAHAPSLLLAQCKAMFITKTTLALILCFF